MAEGNEIMDQNAGRVAMGRRDFLKFTGTSALCACAGALGLGGCTAWREAYEAPLAPPGSYRWEGSRVILEARAAEALIPPGGALRLALGPAEDPAQQILLLRSAEGAYYAFADRCSHKGKPLYFIPEEGMLRCHSGKSKFDLRGQVLRGPAERRLEPYRVRREGEALVVEM